MPHHEFTVEMISQFISLLKLNGKSRTLLANELKKAKPAITPSLIVKQVSKKVGLGPYDLEKIIAALFRVYSCRRQQGHTPEECVDAIVGMMEAKLRRKEHIGKEFRSFLYALFTLDQSIGTSEKALDLAMANDKLTIGLKIYTDIRPAFSSPIENGKIAALILHKLEVTYLENGNRNKVYLTMDSDDLTKLKSVIERANSKESSLRNSKDLKGIQFIEFPND